MTCYRIDEGGPCDCGGRDDGSCFEEPAPKPTGRLRGGLSRVARALRISVSREDVAMTILGALVGGLMGWLFVAMWIR